jgi:DNA polymerase III epsilon subunit-like protein
LSWDNNQCDKQLLIDFLKVANTADEIIAHNGDRFDIKWLRTRCIFHRVPMFPAYRTLDTLKKAKAHFNFPNNKLDTIVQFLGVGAKVKHDGFSMWKKCMEGDKEALKAMVYYCEGDIVALEDAYFVMQNYIKNNTHVGAHNGKLKAGCPTCGSEDVSLLKNNFTALGTIKRQMECNPCGYVYETSNSNWRNFLEFKQNQNI